MKTKLSNYLKVKKEYLKFIKSQEILGEPFRDKIEQLKRFYIPLSEMIYKILEKKKLELSVFLVGKDLANQQFPIF